MANEAITEYWLQHYATEHCTLCGNSGVIDTTGVCTAAGLAVGRRNPCICPNGQSVREHGAVVGVAHVIDPGRDEAACACGHGMKDHIEGFDPCSLCDCQKFRPPDHDEQ